MFVCIAIYILLGFLFLTLPWFAYYRWQDTYLKPLTGPLNLPFFGCLYLVRDTKAIYKILKKMHQLYGKTIKGYFVLVPNIGTYDPDLIEFIMTSNKTINKGSVYKFLHNWLGTGLLTSMSGKWRQRRKLITPAYHFKVLDQFVEMFDRNGTTMVERLQTVVNKSQTDIYPFVNLCALDTICETAMGTCVNAQMSVDSEFVKATKEMSRIIMHRAFDFWKIMDWSYTFTEDYQLEKKALKTLHSYTLNLIKSRRDELLTNVEAKDSVHNNDEFGSKRKDNFLDLLLKSTIDGQPLTDEDIREEVDTFTFEGHDTVSSGISFALYLLSNNQAIQEQVFEEQKHIFGDDPKRTTKLSDLQEMKYLELVIKETLRLYPSVPIIVRTVSETVKYNGMTLKPGTQMVLMVFMLHMDPSIFPEPEVFKPERFLPDNSVGRHPFSYIPFSAGHRNCIGQKFAMLEMKSTISKVIRHYKLLPLVPKHVPDFNPELILRADNGVLMKITARKW